MFITGYAKLPEGITAKELYSVIGIGLIVDRDTGEILDADCSLVTRTGKEFFREIVVGKSLWELDKIAAILNEQYWGHARKPIISALKMCFEKYKAAKNLKVLED